MTAGEAPGAQPPASECAVALDRLGRVHGARGPVPARRRAACPGGLVQTDQHETAALGHGQRRCPCCSGPRACIASDMIACNSPNDKAVASARAPTRYAPGRRTGPSSATTARSRRRSRLRTTAPPTLRPIAYATRGGSVGAPGAKVTVIGPRCTRRRDRRSARNAARWRTRPTTSLRGETMTAFAASCLEDGATGAGGHAVAEAVALRPLACVRLVRPLHRRLPVGRDCRSAVALCPSRHRARRLLPGIRRPTRRPTGVPG